MAKEIFKLAIPECFEYTFEVGKRGVIKIEEDVIQIGTAEGWTPSKMIYRIVFDNGNTIEIAASVSGIVLFKRNMLDKQVMKGE